MACATPEGDSREHEVRLRQIQQHQYLHAFAHCELVEHYCTSTVVAELLTEPASVVENDPGVVETALFNGTFSFQYGL